MATNAEIKARYTEHGLRLIRLANGMAGTSNKELRALSARLRTILRAYDSDASPRELRDVLRAATAAVRGTFQTIATGQGAILTDLVELEAKFALRATALNVGLSERATRRVAGNLLIHGATPAEQWQRQADNMVWQITNAVRSAHASGVPRPDLLAQIIGTGRTGQELGGILEQVMKGARALSDSSVQSAARAAQVATWKVNGKGVNAIQWFGVLDAKICPNCGMRAGKLYTLDFKPIGHSVEMAGTSPLHPFCRCILLPMKFPNGVPEDGGKDVDKFENWLATKSRDEQEDLLGVGRVALWQSGKLTLPQLIGQDGMVMSLSELKGVVDGKR